MSIILPDELNELKKLPQWVAFRLETAEGQAKIRKIPLNPRTGKGAKANDATTWATYDEAVAFAERQGFFENRTGGIGFEFANGIAGVDLDGVILPDGTLATVKASETDYGSSLRYRLLVAHVGNFPTCYLHSLAN